MKIKTKEAEPMKDTEGNPFVGIVMAGLGTLCLAHAVTWRFVLDSSSGTDAFIGAEGLGIWSVCFILLGLTLWWSERRR